MQEIRIPDLTNCINPIKIRKGVASYERVALFRVWKLTAKMLQMKTSRYINPLFFILFNELDFYVKSKLIILLFQTVKLSFLISQFQKYGFHEKVSFIFLLK